MEHIIRFKQIFIFICLWGLITSCAQTKVEPDLLLTTANDRMETQFPPSPEDLTYRKQYILPLMIEVDEQVSILQRVEIENFISDSFLKIGDIYSVDKEEVQTTLEKEKFQGFQSANIPDALLLGRDLSAGFLSQIRVRALKKNDPKHFKGEVDLSVFSVGTGQLAFREVIPYASKSTKRAKVALKKLIQSYFPIKGFILETRGDRQVAKISVGRSTGVALDRIFLIHERSVQSEIVKGTVRKTNSFSTSPVASGRVIQVMENESWILMGKKDRLNVLKGQVVFAKPEKQGMFD